MSLLITNKVKAISLYQREGIIVHFLKKGMIQIF